MGSELSFTSEGGLVIPAAKLGRLKGVDPSQLRIVDLFDDLLISPHPQPGLRPQPILFGDLRLFHVAELMALVSSMRKDGALHLLVPHARKTVFFTDGEVVYASSSVEDDRLGETLWRDGVISLEDLSAVLDLVSANKKLGAILVEKGLITPRQLYEGIKKQVLEIVFSTFHFRKGEFVFVEGTIEVKGAVRLDLNSREVITEGVKRVEQMTRLEELFPDRHLVPMPRPVTVDVRLAEAERHVRRLVDGKKSVGAIVTESHLGEFEALRALAHLRRMGLLDISKSVAWESQEAGQMPAFLEEYAKILRHIHQTLKAEEPAFVARLEAYLGSPTPKHRGVFPNVGFDQDGRLDMDTLFRNAKAAQPKPEKAREIALEALRGFYDYALFQAMDVLDEDAGDAMVKRIESMRAQRAVDAKTGEAPLGFGGE